MLIKQFPDIQWLKKQIREDFNDRKAVGGIPLAQKGWPSVVLNTQTRHVERNDIKGPFSLFFNLKGSSEICVDGKRQEINEQCYALSNAGQHYDLLIDNKACTQTFNVHFGEHFFNSAVYTLSQRSEFLLDNPFETGGTEFNLNLHSRHRTAHHNQAIQRLISAYDKCVETAQEETLLFELLCTVLGAESEEVRRMAAMPLKSRAIKVEIAQRLYVARDFIHAHYHETLSLDLLAQVSSLSKFHFLRLFKALFKQTPYQYQKQLRFEQCISLYQKGFTLEQIAPMIGMDNASSVSRMFHKQAGVYPSQMVYE